jgi:hypothetical protein
VLHPNARPRSTAGLAIAMECCDPKCQAPAQDLVASPVPLCEQHIMDVYKATNKLLTIGKQLDEYALPLPCLRPVRIPRSQRHRARPLPQRILPLRSMGG